MLNCKRPANKGGPEAAAKDIILNIPGLALMPKMIVKSEDKRRFSYRGKPIGPMSSGSHFIKEHFE